MIQLLPSTCLESEEKVGCWREQVSFCWGKRSPSASSELYVAESVRKRAEMSWRMGAALFCRWLDNRSSPVARLSCERGFPVGDMLEDGRRAYKSFASWQIVKRWVVAERKGAWAGQKALRTETARLIYSFLTTFLHGQVALPRATYAAAMGRSCLIIQTDTQFASTDISSEHCRECTEARINVA